jgi:hypothetical protein
MITDNEHFWKFHSNGSHLWYWFMITLLASLQWIPGIFPESKCGRGVLLTTHPLLVLWVKKETGYTSSAPMYQNWHTMGKFYLYLTCFLMHVDTSLACSTTITEPLRLRIFSAEKQARLLSWIHFDGILCWYLLEMSVMPVLPLRCLRLQVKRRVYLINGSRKMKLLFIIR